MADTKLTTLDDLFQKLNEDPGFRSAYRTQKPYYDLIKEIVKRRKDLGLSQQELAERAGMHQSSISRIEAAEHDCQFSTLITIAEALGTRLEIRLVPYSDGEKEWTDLSVKAGEG